MFSNSSQTLKLNDIDLVLQEIAPLETAEEWDNVGLLMGDPQAIVERVMTCLTISSSTIAEALQAKADLIVSHHPCPFRPVAKIVATSSVGNYLWQLAGAGVAVYSPHTAWDNARRGINAQLAERLRLTNVQPMRPTKLIGDRFQGLGTGRVGDLIQARSIRSVAYELGQVLADVKTACSRSLDQPCRRIAVVCGSGGSFVDVAAACRADLLLTGEATYHQYLEAESRNVGLLTIGHFASERFAMEHLAAMLKEAFPKLHVWASESEADSVGSD